MTEQTYNGRELYRPSRDEKMGAIEILLASELHPEARQVLRQMEQEVRQEPRRCE